MVLGLRDFTFEGGNQWPSLPPHGRMGDILFSGPAVFGFMALPSKRQLGKASRIGIWTRG